MQLFLLFTFNFCFVFYFLSEIKYTSNKGEKLTNRKRRLINVNVWCLLWRKSQILQFLFAFIHFLSLFFNIFCVFHSKGHGIVFVFAIFRPKDGWFSMIMMLAILSFYVGYNVFVVFVFYLYFSIIITRKMYDWWR